MVTLILLLLPTFQLQLLEKDNGVNLELLAVDLLLIKEVSLLLMFNLKLLPLQVLNSDSVLLLISDMVLVPLVLLEVLWEVPFVLLL